MDHRTSQNQRKVRFKNTKRRKKAKPQATVEKAVVQTKVDESCQISGCGCGN
ncbi:MAG: hypothetical protein ACJZ2K_05970 [Candidatus Poseidoniaceae archaeon]